MNVLGLNAYHGDSSACLIVDGEIVAAAEEERFNRIKHWSGFPASAIVYCLDEAGMAIGDVDHVAVNRNPRAALAYKIRHVLRTRPRLDFLRDRARNALAWLNLDAALAQAFPSHRIGAQFHHVEHHIAHVASSFLVGPFDRAALLSVDGFGDFSSTLLGVGRDTEIRELGRVRFPYSLGVLYQAVTQHLGFPAYGDEYKVMGLAPYGEPTHVAALRTIAPSRNEWHYELDMRFFAHGRERLGYSWRNQAPAVQRLFSPGANELLGPPREPGDPLEPRHMDIARSLQVRYEEIFLGLVRHLHRRTGLPTMCLAGGCAANSVANGRVLEETGMTGIYIPAAPGDAGGAVGSAAHVWTRLTGRRPAAARTAYLGPAYATEAVEAALRTRAVDLEEARVERLMFADSDSLVRATARSIADGLVVGWFQGRMEWGPRALGNRSILCDPRRADIKELLNRKIKHRESFRPFAPSVLREAVGDFFEIDYDVPFMSQVFRVVPSKRALIPSVVHVDGTGRLQTVDRRDNELYWSLIEAFRVLTGIPLVLNTSFNENEPIVNRPEEAIDCFLRTSMDLLVIGRLALRRRAAAVPHG